MHSVGSEARNQARDRVGRRDFAVAAGCLLGSAIVFWLFRDLRFDDAFITFRYGRNLALGNGFTFNPGERVLGTTTPLFALVSAGLYLLFGDGGLPTAAVAVNALALGAQAFFLYLLLRDRLPWTAVAVAALALFGVFGSHAWLAMETNLFAALVLATVWALARRRLVACGVALGLAFLTRYDAVLLVPLVPFWLRREGWRRALAPLLVAAVPVVPWLLAAGLYFGSPLPTSLGAKSGVTPWPRYLEHCRHLLLRLPGKGASAVNALLAGVAAALGVVHLVRWLRDLAPLALFALAEGIVYVALGPPIDQAWHLYVPQLTVTLLVVIGILGTCERIADFVPSLPPLARWRLPLVAALALLLIWLQALQCYGFSRSYRDDLWLGARHDRYAAVSRWVRAHVTSRPTFLAPEVGTLGYLADARMIDPYGLVSPISGFARKPTATRLVDLIAGHRPRPGAGRFPARGSTAQDVVGLHDGQGLLGLVDPARPRTRRAARPRRAAAAEERGALRRRSRQAGRTGKVTR